VGGAFGGVFGGEGGLVSLLVFGVAVDPPGGVVGGEPAGRVGLGGDRARTNVASIGNGTSRHCQCPIM
jgi:hypothetical protein